MNLALASLVNTLLASILVLTAFWFPQTNAYTEKASPYECSFDPMGSAHLPFSMKFFMVVITFLLFDLEIALLRPLPWATQTNNLKVMLIMSLILLSLLAVSLAYKWCQKGLEWVE